MFGLDAVLFWRPTRREMIRDAALAAAAVVALAKGDEASQTYADAPNPVDIPNAEDFGILILQHKGKPIWGPDAASVVPYAGDGFTVKFEPYEVGKLGTFTGGQLINKRLRIKYPSQAFTRSVSVCCGDTFFLSHTITS